jgi:hypothetical protein
MMRHASIGGKGNRVLKIGTCVAVALLCCISTAHGDWSPEDGHKMHFPQLPDPQGLDVDFEAPNLLADDWLCTETGEVTGIHFWASHREGEIPIIFNLNVELFSNIPATDDTFSRPGDVLWEGSLSGDSFSFASASGGDGDQGWFNPVQGEYVPNDHDSFFQINLTDFKEPFVQKRGEVYWLGISIDTSNADGWKTADLNKYPDPFTGSRYEDDAVYRLTDGSWAELRYPAGHPMEGQSIDLAFVIVPEPTSLSLLTLGGLIVFSLLRYRE